MLEGVDILTIILTLMLPYFAPTRPLNELQCPYLAIDLEVISLRFIRRCWKEPRRGPPQSSLPATAILKLRKNICDQKTLSKFGPGEIKLWD